MSDSIQPDAALVAINARIGELNIEIEQHQRLAETARVVRDELADIVATISRKPRIRKPRVVTEAVSDDERRRWARGAAPCVTEATPDAAEEPPRQTVFVTPCANLPEEAA